MKIIIIIIIVIYEEDRGRRRRRKRYLRVSMFPCCAAMKRGLCPSESR
jgi:hypothetical protein